MIPIVVMDKNSELPAGNCYLIAKGGVYLQKDTGLIKALVKINGISSLQEIKTVAHINLPIIPETITRAVISFFRTVFRLYNSEAVLLIYYNKDSCEYLLLAPIQRVHYTGVSYVSESIPSGFNLVGSVHSHSDFEADYSMIDDENEKHFDGLHIIIGALHRKSLSVSIDLVVNGNRFVQEPTTWLSGLNKIEIPTVHSMPASISRSYWLRFKNEIRYVLNNEDVNQQFPADWLKSVELSSYKSARWRQLALNFDFDINTKTENQ